MIEIWKQIPGYGGHYEASNLGAIRAKARVVRRKSRWGHMVECEYDGRLLTPCKRDPIGHLCVHLGLDGTRLLVDVHRLVLLAFVGPCPSRMEACHGNGDASDNRIENLRWDTHLENNRDRKRHGRYPTGASSPVSKYTDAQIDAVRSGATTPGEAVRKFGMSKTHAHRLSKAGPL